MGGKVESIDTNYFHCMALWKTSSTLHLTVMDDEPGSASWNEVGLRTPSSPQVWQCSSFALDHCADLEMVVVQNDCVFLSSSATCVRAGSRTSLKWWTSPVFKVWVKNWVTVIQCQVYPWAQQFGQSPGSYCWASANTTWLECNEMRSYLFLLPLWLSGGGHP